MPMVHNGCGTWYYGRRRIHRLNGVCASCKQVGELESYDTTLYFVMFFIPLIPLGKKRILESCPRCRRHRVIPLKKWEEAKARDTAALLEKLSANPDDRDAILSGIGLARAYQDEQLFDQLAETLAKHRLNDAAIQAQLGAGYSYFARRAEAEACFKASLAVNDDPNVRTQLALELLRQGRPEEAAPYLQFILDEKLLERLAFIHILIDGYQAQGLHEEALAVIQARETAFPELANDKTWKKQKKNAERYQHSGKKIKSVFLTDSKKAGYREGTWTARVPYLIGPIILLVLLFWYFSAAIHAGRARKVFIVNGLDRAYNVRVNGKECSLAPASAVPMELPEGKVIVEPGDASVLPQPINLRIETPFLSRPFAQRTFVINPDQLAILVHDEQIYSENPGAVKPQVEILIGQPFYDLGSLDYEFQEFPATQPIKKGQVLHKTRVALTPGLRPEVRFAIALTKISAADQSQFARRWLDLQPDDLAALAWVINQKKGKEALAFLEEGLSVRPIRVEWHRAYQSMMEIEHPETDLRPRYKQLIAETHDDPDALYLLARVSDSDPKEAERLLRQGANSQPPSAYAVYALGYQHLSRAEFTLATQWLEKATQARPLHLQFADMYRQSLLAAKKYDKLLPRLEIEKLVLGHHGTVMQMKVLVCGLKGDLVGAQSAIAESLANDVAPGNPKSREVLQAELQGILCCCKNDVAGYLKLGPHLPDQTRFEQALLSGQLEKASGQIAPNTPEAISRHAILYLAAQKANNGKVADQQWQALQASLAKGSGYNRRLATILAGKSELDVTEVRRMIFQPRDKRVLLAVVAQRFPKTAKELLPMAEALDYAPDATSLCLRKVL